MGKLLYSTSMSLDGFVAGIDQGPDHPLGVHGELLHEWLRSLAVWRKEAGLEGGETNANTAVVERGGETIRAIIMGRNMFGGGPGEWDEEWKGWWGDDPPFHMQVFVLTHHPRAPLEMKGGTTFTFVTEGIEAALDLALDAADGMDVGVSGGAGVAKQYLAAGLVDEIGIHLVPAFLGRGVRLFDDPNMAGRIYEQTEVVAGPGVTHLTYRVVR